MGALSSKRTVGFPIFKLRDATSDDISAFVGDNRSGLLNTISEMLIDVSFKISNFHADKVRQLTIRGPPTSCTSTSKL